MARVVRTLAVLSVVAVAGLYAEGVRAQSARAVPEASEQRPDTNPSGKAARKKATSKQDENKAIAGGEKAKDPAVAQKALDAAQKSLDVGKPEFAVSQVNALISGGGLDTRSVARALAIRGHAHRKQNKPAQAIADLQSALWLKGGLSDSERAAATQARAEAYREAGLEDALASTRAVSKGDTAVAKKETAGALNDAPKPTASVKPASTLISTAAVPSRPEPSVPTLAQSPTNGIGTFFSSLFGGGKAKPEMGGASPARSPAEPAVSSWTGGDPGSKSKTTQEKLTSSSAAASRAPHSNATAAETARAGASFKLVLNAGRTRDGAKKIADKLKKEHGISIGERQYEIVETTFGNMGTFYRIHIGPFAESKELGVLCTAIRFEGIDCQVSK